MPGTAVYLVRHGRPAIDHSVPAHEWPLETGGEAPVLALRERLPRDAAWFSSPEPKAIATARLLTDIEVAIVPEFRELVRDNTDWIDDFGSVVHQAFAMPSQPAYDGWEPLARCRDRVVRAAEEILAAHPQQDVVLVGHGTAWTLLEAALTGSEPDLDRWAALGMPDVWVVEQPLALNR